MNQSNAIFTSLCLIGGSLCAAESKGSATQPNIIFLFADDWGRDAGCYADPKTPTPSDIVKTPNIDRVAREGVRFNNAFYDCPQCTPSRASVVSGCYFWRAGSRVFLKGGQWKGVADPYRQLPNFPKMLAGNGYTTGKAIKTLDFAATVDVDDRALTRFSKREPKHIKEIPKDWSAKITSRLRDAFGKLLAGRTPGKPYFFIYGPINTHRPYVPGTGQSIWGINPDTLKGKLPPFLPDVPEVREDYSDYLGQVQVVDLLVGTLLEELEKSGEANNTILVLAGDNGTPGLPRGKTQLYDLGCHGPLIIRWPGHVKPGRTVDDFVTLKDLAPTFLEAAGIKPPATMDARSLMPQLLATQSGTIDAKRDAAIFGRERHNDSTREGNLPYPSRAIRSQDYLYIRNFKPDRTPFGDLVGLDGDAAQVAKIAAICGDYEAQKSAPMRDMDASLTKEWLVAHSRDALGKRFFELAFGKRPAEELYDLKKDPYQMHNLAASPELQPVLKQYAARLENVQTATHDPRLEDAFDRAPYVESRKGQSDDTQE
jgi:N-sulfoglucosamine sulfohydrolase